jgi:hypothetical protein
MSEEKKDNIIEMPTVPQEAVDAASDPGLTPEQMERKKEYAQEKLAKRNARDVKRTSAKLQREAGLPVTRGEFVVIIAKLAKAQETVANHEVLFSYMIDAGIIKDEDLKTWVTTKEEFLQKEQLAKQIADVEAHRAEPQESVPAEGDLGHNIPCDSGLVN